MRNTVVLFCGTLRIPLNKLTIKSKISLEEFRLSILEPVKFNGVDVSSGGVSIDGVANVVEIFSEI